MNKTFLEHTRLADVFSYREISSLGKVVYSNLLSIQYIVDNIWKFKAIDAIEVCDDEIYKDIGKISNGLVDTLVHKEHIKAILKDMI